MALKDMSWVQAIGFEEIRSGRRRQNRFVGRIGFGLLQKLSLTHEHTNRSATYGSIDIIRD